MLSNIYCLFHQQRGWSQINLFAATAAELSAISLQHSFQTPSGAALMLQASRPLTHQMQTVYC